MVLGKGSGHGSISIEPFQREERYMFRNSLKFVQMAFLPSVLLGCGAPQLGAGGEDPAALSGGQVAREGQFPATVAVLAPLDATDPFLCNKEERLCTMTRIAPRAYLSAGHCFADRDQLENHQQVVLSSK